MVYGAIDLHMRYSQIRIVDEARRGACAIGGVVTTRERLTQASPSVRADADSARDRDRERVGCAGARGRRPRGDRRRSELRADVWRADAPDQNRSPRCGGARRGQSPRLVSAGASGVAGAAGDQTDFSQPTVPGPDAVGRGQSAAVAAPAIGLSPRHRQLRDGARPTGAPGGPARARRDAGAVVSTDCGLDDGDSRARRAAADAHRRPMRSSRACAACRGSASSSRRRSAPSSIATSASATPARSVPRSAWCRAKTAPRSAATAATLRKRARASCAAC